ncbi:MAG: PC4/YdbC family ssDNA-binding protein [Clostridia bacterium]|nr:PC4/YdbC family ssDNA-binding protein [Clostridia bacterium]
MAEFKYQVTKVIGTLSETGNGWSKELNLVSWNDRAPVYDLRTWTADHERMGKGITMTKEEIVNLREILNSIDLDD